MLSKHCNHSIKIFSHGTYLRTNKSKLVSLKSKSHVSSSSRQAQNPPDGSFVAESPQSDNIQSDDDMPALADLPSLELHTD